VLHERIEFVTPLTKNPQFRRLWAAQFAAVAAIYALNFAALVVVAEQTLSVTQTGLVLLASIMPAFLGSLIAGAVVDRYDRVRVLMVSHLVRALAALAFWVVVIALLSDVGLIPIYVVLMMGALATQFATPAELSMLPDLVESGQLIGANSLLQTSTLAAEGVGVVLVGPLLSKIADPGAVGLAGAGLSLMAFVLVMPLPRRQIGTRVGEKANALLAQDLDLRAGWQAIVRDRVLRLVTVQVTLVGVLLLILLSIMPVLAAGHLGLQTTDVSFLMIPGGIGFGVGAFVVGRQGNRYACQQWISGGLIALGCAIALMVTFSAGQGMIYLLLLLGAIFGLGVALALAIIPARTVIQKRPAPAMRGRVIAAQLALGNALAVVPLLMGGALADHLGVRPVMAVLAFLAVGSGAAGWRQMQG